MRIEYKKDARYPICEDCLEPIIENDEYFRIRTDHGIWFYHVECFNAFHKKYMTDGGAE